MTLIDAMSLSLGVGLSIALFSKWPNYAYIRPGIYEVRYFRPYAMGLAVVMPYLMGFALTMTIVGLTRQVTYRRKPRPSEWLVMMISLWSQLFLLDSKSVWVNRNRIVRSIFADLDIVHWFLDLFAGPLVVFTIIAILWVARRILPMWVRTAGLVAAILVAILGPIELIEQGLPDLLAPRDGFGPGDLPILHREICLLISQIPFGLLFGVPAMACVNERFRREAWAWSEWMSLNASILVGFAYTLLYRGEIQQISLGWFAERGLLLIWFVTVGMISLMIVVRIGPVFWRFLGADQVQDRSTESTSSTL